MKTRVLGHRPASSPTGQTADGGCKPEPPEFPAPRLQPVEERVQVGHLAAAVEGVVPARQDGADREVYRWLSRTFYAYAIEEQVDQMPDTRFR